MSIVYLFITFYYLLLFIIHLNVTQIIFKYYLNIIQILFKIT